MVNKVQEKELKDVIGEAYAFFLELGDAEFEESAKAYLDACSENPRASVIAKAVIDTVSKRRQTIKENQECEKILFMLSRTPVNEEEYRRQSKIFTCIRDQDVCDNWNMYQAFLYGIIQGKRMERKRKSRKNV